MDSRRPSKALLEIRNLSVRFAMPTGHIDAVQDVSLYIEPGERIALVG